MQKTDRRIARLRDAEVREASKRAPADSPAAVDCGGRREWGALEGYTLMRLRRMPSQGARYCLVHMAAASLSPTTTSFSGSQ